MLNLTQGPSVTSGELIWNLVSSHSKYLCVHLLLKLHFEVGVSVTVDFPLNWSQCQRPCKHSIFEGVFFESLSLLRRLPLESFFAETTTSWNFSVLSVLNSGDAHKVNPSSDLKLYLMIAWARLKKVVWSCHRHPSGVKSNSVSSAPSSISQIFSFLISSHFHIQICGGVTGWCIWFRDYFYKHTFKFSQSRGLVLRYLSTLSQFSSLHVTAVFSTPCMQSHNNRSRIPFLQDNQGTPVYFHCQDLSNNTYLSW